MFETHPELQFHPPAREYKTPEAVRARMKAKRDTVREAGGDAREAYLAYHRAARALYRQRHPEKVAAERKKYKKTYKGELCRRARQRGREKGLEATITQADLVWPTHCPVLGIELDYPEGKYGRRGAGGPQPNSPSLDRWDNTKGYVPGNVFVISMRANSLKNAATYEEILRVAKYLAKRPAR